MTGVFHFICPLRVRYSEIDGQGIVFNAHYLTYMDVAITEYLRNLGFDYKALAASGTMDMALVKTTLEYKASAFFDDLLAIGVRISALGRSSYTVDFEIFRDSSDEVILKAQTIYVNYNAAARAAEPIPEFFREAVERFEN
ncbi:MAG: thioesterase family protein [Desulfitobacteriaceae bacterium]|nr:thioesterase family protein [Desulfitobacteriaceae bacterium]MDI6878211.1 thioesterase family protein [Desulfitobacteriaceae bacterium]MDI6913476.1 thioesterase family protein [Desulfitobacteriaceae bacterium]